ncbi:hypothetical protein V6N12_069793 [Hibiscus sabdariffa]|uniref:Uncharacterized protein n=1 Tax=Hibiscus sabdariffa TaxID=183260 RepID=A0ABR2FEV5_9ROSI
MGKAFDSQDKACTKKVKPAVKSAQVWKPKEVLVSGAESGAPSHGCEVDETALHASKHVELEQSLASKSDAGEQPMPLTGSEHSITSVQNVGDQNAQFAGSGHVVTSEQIIGEKHDQLVDDWLTSADVAFPILHDSVKKKRKR